MKRFLAAALIGLFLTTGLWAALNANDVAEVRTTGAQTNGAFFRWVPLVNATYKWTASGSGTAEYYCEAAAGGDPSLTEPTSVYTNGKHMLASNGTMGSLTAGQWDWGDNDTLGYSTVYVRLSDDTDPDTKIQYGSIIGIGFSGGTDYSQQDAAQVSASVSTDATGTILTATAPVFTAAMVGNGGYLTGGNSAVTAGWYEITVFTNTTTVTIDRSAGASKGLTTPATFNVGGAFKIGGTLDDNFHEALVAGNTVYVQNGTYTLGEAVSMFAAGTTALPINFIGYNGTRSTVPTGANRPTIATTTYGYAAGDYVYHSYFIFTGTSVVSTYTAGTGSVLFQCKFTNASGTRAVLCSSGSNACFIQCEAVASAVGTGVAFSFGAPYCLAYNCYAHDSGTGFAYSGSYYSKTIGCVADTCSAGGIGVGTAYNLLFSSCTVAGCTTGISSTTGYGNRFISNIIAKCVTGATSSSELKSNFWDYNCWNNTTDVSNVTKGPHDITADPLLACTVVTGTDGVTNGAPGTTFTAASNPFSGVTTSDCLLITEAGTGATLGVYAISAVVGDGELTLATSPGASKTGIDYILVKGNDFTLAAGSPCFNAGCTLGTAVGL